MTTPDDKTLDMIVFNARQVAVAMSGEYAELAASADDYRTMADVIAALRKRVAALERHGYVVAMRLMQSEVRLDDAEQAGLDAFITKDAARAALDATDSSLRT